MIPHKIKTPDGEIKFNIPSDWTEVTFWQLCQMRKGEISGLEELAILTGVDLDIWQNVPTKDAQYCSVLLQTALLAKEIPKWEELSPVFRFKMINKFIELPQNIEKHPAGAIEMIRSILGQYEGQEIPMKDVILCFALLCVKPYFGKYTGDGPNQAEKLVEHIKQLPAVIVHPTVNFFFKLWEKPRKGGTNFFTSLQNKLTKTLALKGWINSVILILWTY